MKKTLLLAATGPGIKGVGGVLIGDALSISGVDRVSLAALLPRAMAADLQPERLHRHEVFTPPDEHLAPGSASPGGVIAAWHRRRRIHDPAVRRIAAGVLGMIRQEQPQQVWAVLNSVSVIDVLYHLLPDLDCDLLPQVWDDPEHLGRQRHQDRFARARISRRFLSILSRATRTAVIGEAMAAAYQELAPGRYVVVRHGVVSSPPPPRPDPSSPSEFRIGLSGSMYSPASWRALQQALDLLDWRIDGRQVVLVVAGGRIEFNSRASSADCRFLGWRPPEETLRLMTGCDVLYLPQAFESSHEPLTRLSFPTKLSSYAATGRPVLIHTPTYGSLVRFCARHRAGLVCHSLKPEDIACHLKQLENPDIRREQAESISALVREILNREQFAQGVREFLGADMPPISNGPVQP